MLPTMTLQFSDIATFDTELNATPLLPQAATELNPGFAALLQFRLDSTQTLAAPGGEQLPPTGNGLPLTLSAPDVATDIDIDLRVDAAPGIALVPPGLLPAPALLPSATLSGSMQSPKANGPGTPIVLQEFHSLPDIGREPVPPTGTSPTPAAVLEQAPVLPLAVPVRVGPTQLRPSSQVPQRTDPLVPLAGSDAELAGTERPALAAANRLDQAVRGYSQSEQGAVIEQAFTRDSGPQVPATSTTPQHGVSQVSQSVLSGPTGQPQVATPQVVTPLNQPTQAIALPVSDPAWGEQVGERILLMANNKFQSAEIRLTPAELGPLRVRVSMDDGMVSVSFHAPHATTREAVEQALPRLREMFAENGITLDQAAVGEQGTQPNERETQQASHSPGDSVDPGAQEGDESLPSSHASKVSRGLVDTFA